MRNTIGIIIVFVVITLLGLLLISKMDFEESGISRIDGAPVIDETHPVSTVEQEM